MVGNVRRPSQTPEGALIEGARRRAGLSQEQAGARLGITRARWGALVYGRKVGQQPVTPRAKTWAWMALAVELAPEAFVNELDPPRPDITAHMKQFTSVTEPTTLSPDRQAIVVRMLTNIHEAFGEDAFNAAVRTVVAQNLRRQRRKVGT